MIHGQKNIKWCKWCWQHW